MRKVDNNRITLTKGDTLSFKVNLKYKSDGSDYVIAYSSTEEG